MQVSEADGVSVPGFSWAWIDSAPVRALERDARTSTGKCFHLVWKQRAAFKASQEAWINNNHRLFFRAFGKEGARGFNVVDGFFSQDNCAPSQSLYLSRCWHFERFRQITWHYAPQFGVYFIAFSSSKLVIYFFKFNFLIGKYLNMFKERKSNLMYLTYPFSSFISY